MSTPGKHHHLAQFYLEGFKISHQKGNGSVVSKAQPQSGEPGPQSVSVPAAGSGHRSSESGMGHGYHLHPDGPGLCVPGRDHGLVLAQGAVMACVQRARHPLLRGCHGGRRRGLRCSGDIRYGSGQPVSQRRVHRCSQAARYPHWHGWQGPMDR